MRDCPQKSTKRLGGAAEMEWHLYAAVHRSPSRSLSSPDG